jgi:hypothetical protein
MVLIQPDKEISSNREKWEGQGGCGCRIAFEKYCCRGGVEIGPKQARSAS